MSNQTRSDIFGQYALTQSFIWTMQLLFCLYLYPGYHPILSTMYSYSFCIWLQPIIGSNKADIRQTDNTITWCQSLINNWPHVHCTVLFSLALINDQVTKCRGSLHFQNFKHKENWNSILRSRQIKKEWRSNKFQKHTFATTHNYFAAAFKFCLFCSACVG